jgi:hypothetical protein
VGFGAEESRRISGPPYSLAATALILVSVLIVPSVAVVGISRET